MHLWEKMKEHPYYSGAIIFGGGLVLILLWDSLHSGSAAASGDGGQAAALAQAQAEEAASGNALAAQQQQLQAQTNQTQAQVTAGATDDASQVSIAQIAANQSTNQSQIAADAASETNQLNAAVALQASTVSAQVNANNDTSAAVVNLYDTLATGVQGNPAGAALSGNFNVNTGSFNVSSTAAQTGTGGFATFITDPYGQAYQLEEEFAQVGAIGPNSIDAGVGPNGANIFYVPVQKFAPTPTPGT